MYLTATNQLDDQQILNGEEFVSALAATSDIAFTIPNSKIQVPVPFGLTMEQIAMRYLGDPQLWLEIATLNDLREPYIDENGFVHYNYLATPMVEVSWLGMTMIYLSGKPFIFIPQLKLLRQEPSLTWSCFPLQVFF